MAVTVVQGVSAQALSSAASITTASITTTSGNAVYVVSGTFEGTGGTSANMNAATDNKSNTYTAPAGSVTNLQAGTGANIDGRLDRNKNITGGSGHTFTANAAQTDGFPCIAADEVTGQNTSTAEDGNALGSAVTGQASPHNTPTVTTTVSNDLILGFMVNSNGTTITGTSGTTLDSAKSSASGTPVAVGHKAATTPTTYSCQFSSDTADLVLFTVAVQPAAAGAATAGTITYAYSAN